MQVKVLLKVLTVRLKDPADALHQKQRVYNPICIFCEKDKFLKGSKSREKLTKVVQLRADETLRKCAAQKQDEKIIAITSRDIVAAEAHYHVSCYKNYTRNTAKENNGTEDNEDDYKIVEKKMHLQAFLSSLDLISYPTRRLCQLHR